MANDKDFILKNAIEVGGSTKVTIGDAPASGSVTYGYDLSVAAYDSVSFSVASQTTLPVAGRFGASGTKMFICNYYGNILQYTLSTAYDVSSASYDSVAYNPSEAANLQGLEFKADGTKMYVMDYGGTDSVFQYSLSTAWDISTASYDSKSFSLSPQGTSHQGIFIRQSDGLKLYLMAADDKVYQYTLSTAWDISTASYDSKSYSVNSEETSPTEVFFSSDGLKFFISGLSGDDVTEYSMTTAWDVSTASPTGNTVSSQATQPYGLFFKPDGTKMYIVTDTNDTIYQYSTGSTVATATFDTSTGNYFTHTPSADSEYGFSNAGDVQTFQLEVTGAVSGYELSGAAYDSVSFGVGGQETNPHGLFLKPDGTKLYITGYNGDSVDEYDLSTAWDISSASASQVFYVGSQDTVPTDVFFKSDGTKMYICGYNDQDINEYSLGTAWDISTASYLQNFSISSQDTLVTGVFFKPDGTKMYIAGDTNNSVFQYGLTTAWDISTASYESKSVASQGTAPQQLSFNNDGTKLLILDSSGTDSVYQYSCSTAYDVSTATYDSVSFAVNSQDTTPTGLFFKDDGMKMYVLGDVSNTIYQYSTGSAITITWDADIEWGGGTAPSSPAANQKDLYTITTDDGGTTYFGVPSGVAFS